jgi:hypothetical protein
MAVFIILFLLKWVFTAWLVYIIGVSCRWFVHPFPKAYKGIYHLRFANICLIIFSIIALGIGIPNVVYTFINPFSATLEKVTVYGLITAFAFLIPVSVLSIREEIRAAIKADAETRTNGGAT